uniref:Sperm-associated antigen 8 n=1 Tax=Anas zonorhyncha TaxID=75864 RepID=A0A8B9UMI7_9AVES
MRGDVLLPVGGSCRGDAAGEPPGVVVVDGGEEPGADEEQQEEQEAAAEEVPKVLAVATEPPEVPAPMAVQVVPRGSCLIHNWQEERATNDLDQVPAPEMGSEGFVHRHGHRGLLTLQPPAQPPPSSTTKHAFRLPHSVPMLARGQREAMLELMLYQKYRQELLEEMSPPRAPMESLSTTHRDFQAGGFQPTPLPTTQPHDYRTEQPCSFWLEQARSVPVSTPSPPCPWGQHPLLTGVPVSLSSRASPASAPGTAPFGGTLPSPPPSPSTWSSPCPTSPKATECGRASNKEQAVSLPWHPRVSLRPCAPWLSPVGQGTPITTPCWQPAPPPNAARPRGCVLSPCPRWVTRVPVPVPIQPQARSPQKQTAALGAGCISTK